MRLATVQTFLAWAVVAWALVQRFASPGTSGPTHVPAWLPWTVLGLVLLLDLSALRRLGRLVAIEWLKLRRGRLFCAGLLATIGVTLGAGLTLERLPAASGWSLAASSLGTGLWAAGIFVLVLGATALSGEATGGTLKMLLPHAYRRSDWVLAKAVSLLAAAAIFAAAVAATSLLHAHLAAGLGDVTRELEPLFGETTGGTEVFAPASTVAAHFGEAWLASLAALGTTGLLGLLLSSLFDSVIASLCVAFLVFAGLKFADVVFRVPQEALRHVYTWYPDRMVEVLEKLGRAINERWDEALLGASVTLAAVVAAVCLLLAARVFSLRDV